MRWEKKPRHHSITVHLTADEYETLRDCTRIMGETISGFCRKAIKQRCYRCPIGEPEKESGSV